ncbi:MAG: phosphatase PAP2 family protein, partial [Variovorax sp.]
VVGLLLALLSFAYGVYVIAEYLMFGNRVSGWARVYVGVHFPADIAAGFALAFVLATAFWALVRMTRPRPAIQDPRAEVGTLRDEERRKWRSS